VKTHPLPERGKKGEGGEKKREEREA